MADEPRYRLATPADAPRIAHLHTDSWRRSYRGILTDRYLDGGLIAERAARWQAWAARPADAPDTLTVLAEARAHAGIGTGRGANAAAERGAEAELASGTRVGAEADTASGEAGELVGFVHVVADADPKLGALVDNLHVHPDWRRHGVARRLMGEAGRWLAGTGRSRAFLYVLSANTRAQAFYDAVGGIRGEAGMWQPPEGPEVEDIEYQWPDVAVLTGLVPPGVPPLR